MKASIKKIVNSSLITLALLGGCHSVAHADTYKVTLSNVWAYEDADYRPGPAGDVRLDISIDGETLFSNYGEKIMKLNDKTRNRVYFKNRDYKTSNRKSKVVEGNFTVKISASEYDGNSDHEKCEGDNWHHPGSLGEFKLDCAGDLGLYLHYTVKKIN